jgi:phosphatidylglycerophosphate synthase
MDSFLNPIRNSVKKVMHQVAVALNALSGGRLTPNMVTIVGLLAHIPIAWMIANNYLIVAGLWLIVFGLFDTLDGELARLQKRDSPAGMFLDSVTDRIKEIMIYIGLSAYILYNNYSSGVGFPECGKTVFCSDALAGTITNNPLTVLLIIGILGGSLLTSYLNAWGETVLIRAGASKTTLNKTFRGGLASFEVRMTLLVIALLTGYILPIMLLLSILVVLTIIGRMAKVFRELNRVQS